MAQSTARPQNLSARIMHIGAKGIVFGVNSACASGAQAIGVGANLIASGLIDGAVVGGSDACHSLGYLSAWDSLSVVSSEICWPFAANRDGLSIGEGVAVLVLERHRAENLNRAVARLLGFGMSADAGEITSPQTEGMVGSMRAALISSGLRPKAIGYINAHGTGTRLNDLCETQAISDVFADCPDQPVISSTKPIHGHTMGAAGAIEAVNRREVPIQLLGIEDPEITIDPTSENADIDAPKYVMSNSFAFGGINCSLIFG